MNHALYGPLEFDIEASIQEAKRVQEQARFLKCTEQNVQGTPDISVPAPRMSMAARPRDG
jgi:hypothetical protein